MYHNIHQFVYLDIVIVFYICLCCLGWGHYGNIYNL